MYDEKDQKALDQHIVHVTTGDAGGHKKITGECAGVSNMVWASLAH